MDILMKKSKENNEIADIAAEKEYYHVAISRKYYSIYQMLIYLIELLGITEIDSKTDNKKGSHDITIDIFQNHIQYNYEVYDLELPDVMKIFNIRKMKKARKKSDYEAKIITRKEFAENNRRYTKTKTVLEKIISNNKEE